MTQTAPDTAVGEVPSASTDRRDGLRRTPGRTVRGLRSVVGGSTRRVRDAAGAVEDVVGGAVRALASPTGLAGAAVEAAWLTTHAALYPFGLRTGTSGQGERGYRIEHLPPIQRGLVISDVEAAGTPILLVHGMVDNHSIFTLLRLGLRRRGFGQVVSMNYSPLTSDVRTAAARLAEEVEALTESTGYDRIHIVGHSMGGLIARYYVSRLGGDSRVHTLVTLGTPHQGTYTAYGWPTQLCRQLRPDSSLMRELAAPMPTCRTRFVCYWSDLDQMIFPQRNAALDHPGLSVRNIAMHGIGHMSLPIFGSVVHGIGATLALLDSDGSTITPGTIPIMSSSHPARETRDFA